MTFTNRTGEDIFVKLSSDDEQKVLRASDSRVCFLYRETSDSDKLQVCPVISKRSMLVCCIFDLYFFLLFMTISSIFKCQLCVYVTCPLSCIY